MNVIRHFFKIKLLFLPIFLLVGCTSNEEQVAALDQIHIQIDSSNHVLKSAYYCRDDTFRQADSVLQFSKIVKYKQGEIQALTNVVRHHIRNNRTKEIILLYDEYQPIIDETKPDAVKAELLFSLGNMALSLQHWDAALDHAFHAEKVYNSLHDDFGLAETMALLGNIYSSKIDRDKAMEYVQASLDLSLKIGFERGAARAYNNLGNFYMMPKLDAETALSYFHKAKAINERLGYTDYLTVNYNNIASILCATGSCGEAEKLFEQSYAVAHKANDRVSKIFIAFKTFNLLKKSGRTEKAIQNIMQARDTATFYQLPHLASICNNILYKHYEQKGNDKLALESYIQYRNTEDSLNLKRNAIEILKLEKKHEKVQGKIESKAERMRFNLLLMLFGTFLLSACYIAYQKYKQKVKEIVNKQRENKLLTEKLELKNKELTSNIVHQIRLSENRKQISDYLKEEKKKFSASYYPILDKIIDKLNHDNQEHVWSEFEFHFNQIHQSFFQTLSAKYPNITVNEKRLCAFLIMNMNTREISALTGQSERAIHQARTRLRNKIGIKGKSISISNFLASLENQN